MADQTITAIPKLITAADTSDSILTINAGLKNPTHAYTIFIEVVSGTFRFNVGGDAADSDNTWTAGDKVPPLTVNDSNKKLRFQAASGTDTFTIGL